MLAFLWCLMVGHEWLKVLGGEHLCCRCWALRGLDGVLRW